MSRTEDVAVGTAAANTDIVAGFGAAVAVGDELEREGKSRVHDSADRDCHVVAQVWRGSVSAELMNNVRQTEAGNAEETLKGEEKGFVRQYQLEMNIRCWPFRNQAENLWNLERRCVMRATRLPCRAAQHFKSMSLLCIRLGTPEGRD